MCEYGDQLVSNRPTTPNQQSPPKTFQQSKTYRGTDL